MFVGVSMCACMRMSALCDSKKMLLKTSTKGKEKSVEKGTSRALLPVIT
jgi:hypothetical protein